MRVGSVANDAQRSLTFRSKRRCCPRSADLPLRTGCSRRNTPAPAHIRMTIANGAGGDHTERLETGTHVRDIARRLEFGEDAVFRTRRGAGYAWGPRQENSENLLPLCSATRESRSHLQDGNLFLISVSQPTGSLQILLEIPRIFAPYASSRNSENICPLVGPFDAHPSVLGLRPLGRVPFVTELEAGGSAIEVPVDLFARLIHPTIPESRLSAQS